MNKPRRVIGNSLRHLMLSFFLPPVSQFFDHFIEMRPCFLANPLRGQDLAPRGVIKLAPQPLASQAIFKNESIVTQVRYSAVVRVEVALEGVPSVPTDTIIAPRHEGACCTGSANHKRPASR
jgi:hypothetical protein